MKGSEAMQLESWIRYGETGKPNTLVIRIPDDLLEVLEVKDVEIYNNSPSKGVTEKRYKQDDSYSKTFTVALSSDLPRCNLYDQ
jgi:hypothetical protein